MLPCICDWVSDNNECLIGTHNCHEVAECTNTNGSFYCNCTPGFDGNGTYCQGICNIAPFCAIKMIVSYIYSGWFVTPYSNIYQPQPKMVESFSGTVQLNQPLDVSF